jgi:hypothetical protein
MKAIKNIFKVEKYQVGNKPMWFLLIKNKGSKTFGDAYSLRIR